MIIDMVFEEVINKLKDNIIDHCYNRCNFTQQGNYCTKSNKQECIYLKGLNDSINIVRKIREDL